MEEQNKRKNRAAKIVVSAFISIVAVVAAIIIVKSFVIKLYGQYIYRSEKIIDLSFSGITDVSGLMRLEDPGIIDLRGDPISVEQYNVLTERFPDCDIIWDVPLSSGSFSCFSESLTPDSFERSDISLLTYFKNLSLLDLSETDISSDLFNEIKASVPDCEIIWEVELLGNKYSRDLKTIVLDGQELGVNDIRIIAERLEYLKKIIINDCRLTVAEQIELKKQYPDLLFYWDIRLLGQLIPNDAVNLKLNISTRNELSELEQAGELFTDCETIDLGGSLMEVADISELSDSFGGAAVLCNFSFMNRTISTAAAELDFSGIKDIDITAFDAIVRVVPGLEKVVMCNCGISDETMDELNHKYDGVRFIWTVHIARVYELRTDVTYFCASDRPDANYVAISLNDEEIQPLKYCTDLIALDLGHMHYHNCDFVKDMKQLRYLIVSCGYVNDISAVSELENLYYFEMAFSDVHDITPLLNCKNLRCLNINACQVYDREILAKMDYLEYLFYTNDKLPEEDVEWIKNALPNTYCYVFDSIQDRYGHEWRSIPAYYEMRDIFHMFY